MSYYNSHPYIVTTGTWFQWEDSIAVIMEYCDGSLSDFMDEQVSEPFIWSIIGRISSGLCYLHDQDIIHNNVNPSTVFTFEGMYFFFFDIY